MTNTTPTTTAETAIAKIPRIGRRIKNSPTPTFTMNRNYHRYGC